MRARFGAAPGRERLTARPLHVVVRDFPETLAPLRQMEVDLEAHGGVPLSELDGDLEARVGALLEVTGWRGDDG